MMNLETGHCSAWYASVDLPELMSLLSATICMFTCWRRAGGGGKSLHQGCGAERDGFQLVLSQSAMRMHSFRSLTRAAVDHYLNLCSDIAYLHVQLQVVLSEQCTDVSVNGLTFC